MGKWLVSAVLVLSEGTCFAGRQRGGFPEVDPERTVSIIGEIGGRNTLTIADRILKLATTTEDIYLIINSPGGAVLPGTFILSAMEIAHARGVSFTCLVPGMAASFGFQIFAYCDRRFAFPNAYLLFHPVRTGVNGAITPLAAKQMALDLERMESTLVADLRARFPLDDEQFWWNYHNETMWRADELLVLVPDWFTLVQDAPGITQLSPLVPSPFDFSQGEIIWTISPAVWAGFRR